MDQLTSELKSLIKKWRKSATSRGGGASCQSEEMRFLMNKALRECAADLESLLNKDKIMGITFPNKRKILNKRLDNQPRF